FPSGVASEQSVTSYRKVGGTGDIHVRLQGRNSLLTHVFKFVGVFARQAYPIPEC
ncbi:Uncharacterized protein HZ326_27567, partial [Fusarium oxysporum f. sp. albedinis]